MKALTTGQWCPGIICDERNGSVGMGVHEKSIDQTVQLRERSKSSLAVQEQWSRLRSEGELILPRSAFDPKYFVEFLPFLVMAELDLTTKTMPIRLAGSAIRDLVGFELTGKNFLDFDSEPNKEPGWRHRVAYHDHPCGRYEVLDVRYSSRLCRECALTILPLLGSRGERLIFVYVERIESTMPHHDEGTATIAEPVKMAMHIDIGSGVPDFPALPL